MIDALLDLPAHLRQASGERSGVGTAPRRPAQRLPASGPGHARRQPRRSLAPCASWSDWGSPGPRPAAWIRTVEKAAARTPKPDLVWSGPEVPGLHARDTRRVYEELLGSAERSVWASTYAFFDGPKAFEVLARRMDARPDLQRHAAAEHPAEVGRHDRGGSLGAEVQRAVLDEGLARRSEAPRVLRSALARARGAAGVLHAKAVVIDDESVFVTSANLTEAALDRNIEMGLLVRDRALALSISSHFRILIERGLLRPLP